MRVRIRVSLSALALPTLVLLAAGALAGCGGGSSTSSSAAGGAPVAAPGAPAISTQGSTPSVDAVAFVARTPIAKSSYEHWLSVERRLGAGTNLSHKTLGFLITSAWVLGEGAAQGVSVSEAEVKQRLAQLERQSFPQANSFQRYLARTGESEADLLRRVKVELANARLDAKVTAAKSGSQRKSALAAFEQGFQRRWRDRTTCERGYVMEDCSQYRGKREDLTVTSSSSGSSAARSASSSTSSSTGSGGGGSSGGSPSAATSASGGLAIASPALGPNGAIPSRYTCDGANITPPLEWQGVPANAAALVLFVIDDTPSGPTSGIRWVVANIDPHSKGVAAGATPAGGIVGADSQGHSGYGGICPAHGKTSTIEFVLYPLSKKIPVSPGFQPEVAEREYGAGKLLLSSAAVAHAVYHRP